MAAGLKVTSTMWRARVCAPFSLWSQCRVNGMFGNVMLSHATRRIPASARTISSARSAAAAAASAAVGAGAEGAEVAPMPKFTGMAMVTHPSELVIDSPWSVYTYVLESAHAYLGLPWWVLVPTVAFVGEESAIT